MRYFAIEPKTRRMFNFRTRLSILVAWSLTVIALLIWPIASCVKEGFTYRDKLVHIVIFGLLSFLTAYALEGFKEYSTKQILRYSLIFSLIFAAFGEVVQHFIPYRDFSVVDVLAGLAGIILSLAIFYRVFKKPKLLLHICCVGCGVYVAELLKKDYDLALFFHNPSIFPKEEHDIRLEESRKIAKRYDLELKIGSEDHKAWLKKVEGYEQEPEKGRRCLICYRDRLEATAKYAKKHGFQYFTTTLTTSPHKLSREISLIGQEIAVKYGVKFIDKDFKKADGFKKSSQLSKELGLYRQNYCGCEFSRRK